MHGTAFYIEEISSLNWHFCQQKASQFLSSICWRSSSLTWHYARNNLWTFIRSDNVPALCFFQVRLHARVHKHRLGELERWASHWHQNFCQKWKYRFWTVTKQFTCSAYKVARSVPSKRPLATLETPFGWAEIAQYSQFFHLDVITKLIVAWYHPRFFSCITDCKNNGSDMSISCLIFPPSL